jgi:hypothetical protein
VCLALRIGIDIACRASHRAACADSTGQLLWRNVRFQTRIADLEALWARIPEGEDDITVVMEPTRNAWVPLAAWFRRHGAQVVMWGSLDFVDTDQGVTCVSVAAAMNRCSWSIGLM